IGFGLTTLKMARAGAIVDLESDGISNWEIVHGEWAPTFSGVNLTISANLELGSIQLPYDIYLPANGANPGSQGSCTTHPSGASDDYVCKCAGTTVETFSFAATTGILTVTTPSGATQTCAAKSRFACFAPATTHGSVGCVLTPMGNHL